MMMKLETWTLKVWEGECYTQGKSLNCNYSEKQNDYVGYIL